MMTVFDIWFKEWKAQTNLFAVRVGVSPLTQESDIVAEMNPLLDPLGVVYRFDEVVCATKVPDMDAMQAVLSAQLVWFQLLSWHAGESAAAVVRYVTGLL